MIDAAMPIAMRADFTSRSSTASKQFYNTTTCTIRAVCTISAILISHEKLEAYHFRRSQ